MTAVPTPGPLLAADGRNYWVCTTRANGRPHALPVWGLWMDGALWFSTDPTSVKARNLARDPEIVVHLESADEVCVLEGAVRRISVADLPVGFVDAYEAKYSLRMEPSNENYGFFVLAPRVALTWTEADFPITATRWMF